MLNPKKKSLTEATKSNYTIEDLDRLLSIDDDTGYELGIIPQPKDSETPFAWDAGMAIVDGKVQINGGFMPGGPEAGKVNIECRFDAFQRSFELRCDYYAIDGLDISEEDKEFIRSMCNPY